MRLVKMTSFHTATNMLACLHIHGTAVWSRAYRFAMNFNSCATSSGVQHDRATYKVKIHCKARRAVLVCLVCWSVWAGACRTKSIPVSEAQHEQRVMVSIWGHHLTQLCNGHWPLWSCFAVRTGPYPCPAVWRVELKYEAVLSCSQEGWSGWWQ